MKAKLKTQPDLIPMFLKGLRESVVALTFTKKDGTSREMNATLNPLLIPTEHQPKGNATVVADIDEEPTFVRVFDVDAKGWRTVIFDAVTEFGPAALV
jgi:hypothetical protein